MGGDKLCKKHNMIYMEYCLGCALGLEEVSPLDTKEGVEQQPTTAAAQNGGDYRSCMSRYGEGD